MHFPPFRYLDSSRTIPPPPIIWRLWGWSTTMLDRSCNWDFTESIGKLWNLNRTKRWWLDKMLSMRRGRHLPTVKLKGGFNRTCRHRARSWQESAYCQRIKRLVVPQESVKWLTNSHMLYTRSCWLLFPRNVGRKWVTEVSPGWKPRDQRGNKQLKSPSQKRRQPTVTCCSTWEQTEMGEREILQYCLKGTVGFPSSQEMVTVRPGKDRKAWLHCFNINFLYNAFNLNKYICF